MQGRANNAEVLANAFRTVKADPNSLSEGDTVSWDSSGGRARGRIRRIVTSGTVSPSTTDEEFEGSDDDPAFLIELVDDDGEGRDETVVHRAGTLRKLKSARSDVAPDARSSDLWVADGGGFKDLSDTGLFGGWLVRHDGNTVDLDRDFFHAGTDHWLDNGKGHTHVLYGHGWDPALGRRRLGTGRLATRSDGGEAGVWLETQLTARDEYEEMVLELARRGKLGLSSGTAGHLIERKHVGDGVFRIDEWPLGLDASPTPRPAEPRTSFGPVDTPSIPPLKTLIDDDAGFGSDVEKALAAALAELNEVAGRRAVHERVDFDRLESEITELNRRFHR
jgi:hypothetical protein